VLTGPVRRPVTLVGMNSVSRARRTAWIVAAVLAWTVNPVVLLITIWPTGIGRDCASPPGDPSDVPPGCPREGLIWLAGLFMLACWLLLTSTVGLVFGVIEGAHHRFARGGVVAAVLITIAAPWAMIAFAAGNGVARLVGGGFKKP